MVNTAAQLNDDPDADADEDESSLSEVESMVRALGNLHNNSADVLSRRTMSAEGMEVRLLELSRLQLHRRLCSQCMYHAFVLSACTTTAFKCDVP